MCRSCVQDIAVTGDQCIDHFLALMSRKVTEYVLKAGFADEQKLREDRGLHLLLAHPAVAGEAALAEVVPPAQQRPQRLRLPLGHVEERAAGRVQHGEVGGEPDLDQAAGDEVHVPADVPRVVDAHLGRADLLAEGHGHAALGLRTAGGQDGHGVQRGLVHLQAHLHAQGHRQVLHDTLLVQRAILHPQPLVVQVHRLLQARGEAPVRHVRLQGLHLHLERVLPALVDAGQVGRNRTDHGPENTGACQADPVFPERLDVCLGPNISVAHTAQAGDDKEESSIVGNKRFDTKDVMLPS
mmetsp:Transcript_18858/g.29714  ORF Transcript_18858/g.29714 Transcript_18858/m.29714 type:complete len:297 (-) Transcript_18858:231-1121(-)